jgi:hypothetical protein
MTRDKEVFTIPVQLVADPRSKYTAEERAAQFALAMKLYSLLGEMTLAVERINGTRLSLDERASRLPVSDPLAKRLQSESAQIDELRRKIVATKEGGMITGEERLRENLADLYGNVVNYEGRPSQTQIERTDAIARELADVVKTFDSWRTNQLAGLNAALAKKNLEPIEIATREEQGRKTGGQR